MREVEPSVGTGRSVGQIHKIDRVFLPLEWREPQSTSDDARRRRVLLIVGIGASAGGLDAFKSFFANMPADSGMAFVLVQHLSPDHKSMLAELIGKTTSMPVIEAPDGAEVTANHVFIIPPDATMTIAGGRLQVVRPAPPRERRRPIDSFFESLAEDQGENAICIVLSGTGSDGTLGMAVIKERGGLTLAQAEYDSHAMAGMPHSAAASGQVDEVLAVEDMPAKLMAYRLHLANVAEVKDGDGTRTDTGSHLTAILTALRVRIGHDFSEYKEKTLVRRLQRRMQVLQVDTPQDYLERLRDRPEELDLLFCELLIGVTQFFRDPEAFKALDERVVRELTTARAVDDQIRVWIPGCATGQEAYSIAILIAEAIDARQPRPSVQIFGTDIDDRAIDIARLGRFRKPLAGLAPERIERWFVDEGETCLVLPEIREMCIFSTHSVIKHPPFSKLDLISCRNLLIYFSAPVQDRLMRTFHYALKPRGKLLLGLSESVTRAGRLFDVFDKKSRIFERRDVVATSLPSFATEPRGPASAGGAETTQMSAGDRLDKSIRRVMEKHYPAHLVIDRRQQIVRFSGGELAPYLEPAPGAPSFALFDMLRKSLRPAARALLQKLRNGGGAVRHDDLPIRVDGTQRSATLIAERLAEQGPEAGFVVLAFQDNGEVPARGRSEDADGESAEVFKALQQELRTTRAQLQASIDELETANEEMKSSNEEYQSVNEELQSANEELETAKEELQSVNEELQTINAEMIGKNEQLTGLNSDLSNLLESTEIATLFLDRHLRVRRFTRGVGEIFHLRESDVGRPITEIVNRMSYPELQADMRAVLRSLNVVERQITLEDGQTTFMARIRPYRTVDDVIGGVVLLFMDITDRRAYQSLRESEGRFRLLFDSIDEGFCTLGRIEGSSGVDFQHLTANPAFEVQSGIGDVIGKPIRAVVPDEADSWIAIYDEVWRTGEPMRFERMVEANGRYLELFAFRLEQEAHREIGVIFRDVSHRKRHEEQQELLLKEMDHRIKNLFAIASGAVSLSARSATSTREMADTIQGRLGALATAHQLVRPRWVDGVELSAQTSLDALVSTILIPFIEGPGEHAQSAIRGPEVVIGGTAVTSMALVLHELATNAAKYGALSLPTGRLDISWRLSDGRLELTWRERDGPVIEGPPAREGFGSLLARRSISGQLKGTLDYAWDRAGLTVHLSAAAERLRPSALS